MITHIVFLISYEHLLNIFTSTSSAFVSLLIPMDGFPPFLSENYHWLFLMVVLSIIVLPFLVLTYRTERLVSRLVYLRVL